MADHVTIGRLEKLTAVLDELIAESYSVRERAMDAAAQARTWPDLKRATQFLVDVQSSLRRDR